jgi:hypothetical protein
LRRFYPAAITLAVLAVFGAFRVRSESRYWPNSHDVPMSWLTAGEWVAAILAMAALVGALAWVVVRPREAPMFWAGLILTFVALVVLVPEIV